MKISFKLLVTVVLAALIAMPAIAEAGGNHSTVNKSIRIDSDTTAGDVSSVNGSIRIGDNSFVESVDSVNGSVKIGNDVTVEGDVGSVNGAINLEAGCVVGDDVESVNGGIRLQNTQVSGNVETVNGQVRILDRSEVSGNLLVKKPNGWNHNSRNKPVRVEIGKDVLIHGDLIFEHPVELKLHETARVGEIIGDDVEMAGSS